MTEYSDEELLTIISMKDDEPVEAKNAFAEFHKRFKCTVWEYACTLSKTCPNPKLVSEDILRDTFMVVWEKAEKFDLKKCKSEEKGIKVWLGGIAKNQVLQYFDYAKKESRHIGHLEVCMDIFPMEDDLPMKETLLLSLKTKEVKRIFEEKLTDREREILSIYSNFGVNEKIPKYIQETLCKVYHLLPTSFNKTKQRALQKMKKHLVKSPLFTVKK